jgi:hypothetical protein
MTVMSYQAARVRELEPTRSGGHMHDSCIMSGSLDSALIC